MPAENRKKKSIYASWESFNQTLNNYAPHKNKIRKIQTQGFCRLFAESKARVFMPKFGKFL